MRIYSRLEKQSDPIVLDVAQDDRINTVHKVDDSTNISMATQENNKSDPCINKLFTHLQISTIKWM